jgi:hypothetical protein
MRECNRGFDAYDALGDGIEQSSNARKLARRLSREYDWLCGNSVCACLHENRRAELANEESRLVRATSQRRLTGMSLSKSTCTTSVKVLVAPAGTVASSIALARVSTALRSHFI